VKLDSKNGPTVLGMANPPQASPIPHYVSSSNKDKEWQPTTEQAVQIVEQAGKYFSAKDEQRFVDAYVYLAADHKRVIPFEVWKADLENFYGQAGKLESRTILKVTWYKNPPNGQGGIYVATNFSALFPNLLLHCGYAMWQQQSDGSFAVIREEESSAPISMKNLSAEKRQQVRSRLGC
jgi:hypothetical protein